MKTKSSIAVIGHHQKMDQETISLLSGSGQRLLLFDCDSQLLQSDTQMNPETEVEVIRCAKDASWEADLVVIAVEGPELESICQKIKPYVTQKTVITCLSNEAAENGHRKKMEDCLPDSEIITVSDLRELKKVLESFIPHK